MIVVEMRQNITGTRDGVPWPVVGATIELPDAEADRMVAAGYCAYTDDRTPPVEDAAEAPAPRKSRRRAAKETDGADTAHSDEEPVPDSDEAAPVEGSDDGPVPDGKPAKS